MKELSIEQKAKAYDELKVKASRIYNKENDVLIMHTLEDLFPELAESEDEKIRKSLIDMLKNDEKCYLKEIAWLEKQSEQGNNEDEAILHRFSFYSYKDEPNILYLAGLYVNDEYRNKGIGTKILKIADEVAVSMKCSSILLKTEIGSNAERLYKNNGYSVFRMEENQVWLEKQGKQKSDEWSEEDERNLNVATNILNASKVYTKSPDKYEDTINWLKSLKDRVQLKREWNEENKKMLECAIDMIEWYSVVNKSKSRLVSDWLKSIRPHSQWEPSDEQMKAIEESLYHVTDDIETVLAGLYEDLKKLKEK